MKFTIAPQIFEKFPSTTIGLIHVTGADNHNDSRTEAELLRGEETRLRAMMKKDDITNLPAISAWRETFRAFGVKPGDARSSIESLLRSVLSDRDIRRINPLVDLYNYISLRYLLPVGGEDLSQINGDVHLCFAGENEPAILLLGDETPVAPLPCEVIYKDDEGAICRRWNWREADRTKLTPGTTECILVIERVAPVERSILESALTELSDSANRLLGAQCKSFILDHQNPEASW